MSSNKAIPAVVIILVLFSIAVGLIIAGYIYSGVERLNQKIIPKTLIRLSKTQPASKKVLILPPIYIFNNSTLPPSDPNYIARSRHRRYRHRK